jgi:tetratricopeptide (TPR) repeat protein
MIKNRELLEDGHVMANEHDLERLRHAYDLLHTDRFRAMKELENLANEGSVMSALYLADCFEQEPTIKIDQAEKWLKFAFEQGSARGLFKLAEHYTKIQDYDDAEKVYQVGVSQNDGPSMYYLAKLYMKTNRYKVTSSEIRSLLEKAAALGQAKAARDLWLLYIKGVFGIWNIPKGVFLLVGFILKAFKLTVVQRTGAYGPNDRKLW